MSESVVRAQLQRSKNRIGELEGHVARLKRRQSLKKYQLYEISGPATHPDFLFLDETAIGDKRRTHDVPLFRDKKVVGFFGHPNDPVRAGGLIHMVNRPGPNDRPINDVEIAIVGTGRRGVKDKYAAGHMAKIDLRIEEGRQAAAALGLRADRMSRVDDEFGFRYGQYRFFNAWKTYDDRKIDVTDLARIRSYIKSTKPDVVLLPPKGDIKEIDRDTRKMVLEGVRSYLEEEHRSGGKKEVLLIEPSTFSEDEVPDRNLWVMYKNPILLDETRKKAIAAHKSQEIEYSEMFEDAEFAKKAQDDFDGVVDHPDKAEVARLLDYKKHAPIFSDKRIQHRGEQFRVLRARVDVRNKVPVVKIEALRDPGLAFARMAGIVSPDQKDLREKRWYRAERLAKRRESRKASGDRRKAAYKKKKTEDWVRRHGV